MKSEGRGAIGEKIGVYVFTLIVFVLAVLPFVRTLNYGFINCDDYDYVTVERTPLVTGGVSWSGAKYAVTDLSHGIWMPLTWASYMADFSFFGGRPGAMHLHSVALHGVNAALVFLLLWLVMQGTTMGGAYLLQSQREPRACRGRSGNLELFWCALCAVLWAIHPLRVESVAWIASRKDVLSFLFELLALICWVRGSRGQETRRFIVTALGFFVLATMAKPSAMTFPLLALLLDWLHGVRQTKNKKIVLAIGGAWGIGIAVLAAYAQKVGGATTASADIPLWWKCTNACAAFGMYLKNTVWPLDLAPQCLRRWPDMPRFWWQGVILSGLAALCILKWAESVRIAWRRGDGIIGDWPQGTWRWAMAAALWFIVAWGPMSGVSGFGLHAFADRFTYIPALGISLALVGVGRMIVDCSAIVRKAVSCVCVLYCVALGCATWWQVGFWQGEEALWTHTLEVDGEQNAYALRSLATYNFENGHDVKKVADLLGRALESCEDAVGPATLIYIVSLCEDGRNDEAMKILSRLQKWHDRQVKGHEESEEANSPRWGGEPIGEANTRLVYAEKKPGTWDMAKAVWMATQGSMMSVSLEILDSVEKENPDLGMLLYLRGLFAKWRGNNDEAKRYWKRLLEHGRGDPFLKFSFVRKWVAE